MEMNPQDEKPATQGMLKNLATKDDLRAFATKDDLRAFATKDDLRAFATKDDLRAFATKEELRKEIDRLEGRISSFEHKTGVEFAQLKGKFVDLENSVGQQLRAATIEQKGQLDAFLNELQTATRESRTFPKRLDDHAEQIRGHERRIVAIEARMPSPEQP